LAAVAAARPEGAPREKPRGTAARRLRVGLFAATRRQPRWIAQAFARVAASDFAEIALIEAGGGAPASPSLAWRLYGALDRRVFGSDPSDLVDLAEKVPHGSSAADLDVAFALGDIDDAPLDGIARFGVWRFSFGERHDEGEALGGVVEVAGGDPLSVSGLKVRLAPGAPERLACQSWARTYPFSVARNRDGLLRKTAEFPWRALREVHRSGKAWLENRGQSPISDISATTMGNRALTPISIGRRLLARGIEKALHVEQWSLAWRWGEPALEGDLDGFTRFAPPKDRTWADPFVLEKNGRYFVFFEELAFARGKAHISMVELERGRPPTPPVKVLERPYHLSYPFLVEEEGELYMIPESAQNGTVELYRCVDFPQRWRLEKVLLEGVRLVDSTLHRGADRWWMFANAAAPGSRVFDDELHLYSAPGLFGDWRPHPANPVKSDARGARPAGRLYARNGALHRPAQICVPLYGAGLSLNRVTRLSADEYAERQVSRVLPAGRGILGIHTVNRAGDLTVVDAFTRRLRFT
jgi:hypothetical protein